MEQGSKSDGEQQSKGGAREALRQVFSYYGVSLAQTFIEFGVFALLQALGVLSTLANALAVGVSATFNFLMNRIINTASSAGYDGNAGFGAYGMAKEAIRAITRTAAHEWGKLGITVNVFLPNIATDFFRQSQPEALKSLEAKSPLGRIGTTEEDCAPLIVFLASDESGYLTGQSFMVDGGIHMHS